MDFLCKKYWIREALKKMRISTCTTIKMLTTITMIAFILAAISGYLGYEFIQNLNKAKSEQVHKLKESEWLFIESILKENYDKSHEHAMTIRSEILREIHKEYESDKTRLREDLVSSDHNSPVYKVFSSVLRGKYLNSIKNDRNDSFIMSTRGVITDLSISRAIRLQNNACADRDWVVEGDIHYNKELIRLTIQNIIEKSDKPVFWEFSKPDDINHTYVTNMELTEIRNVYYREGIQGIKNYEFGKAAYIFEHEDLFGTPDVTPLGGYTNNEKLIIVSGFSLYDIIVAKHQPILTNYKDVIEHVEMLYCHTSKAMAQTTSIIILLFLAGSILMGYIQHLVLSKTRVGGENEHRNIS